MYDKWGIGLVRLLALAGVIAWLLTSDTKWALAGIYALGVLNDMQLQNMRS